MLRGGGGVTHLARGGTPSRSSRGGVPHLVRGYTIQVQPGGYPIQVQPGGTPTGRGYQLGGVPQPSPARGDPTWPMGYPIQVHLGGYPGQVQPGQDGAGYLRWGTPPGREGYPQPGQDRGTQDGGTPLAGKGYPPPRDRIADRVLDRPRSVSTGIRVQFTLSNFRYEETKQKQGVKPLEHENVEIEFSGTYPDAIKIIHVQRFSLVNSSICVMLNCIIMGTSP